MNDHEMTDRQERAVRKCGAHTVPYDDGSWGWSTDFGEDYGYESEEQAWAAMLAAIDDSAPIPEAGDWDDCYSICIPADFPGIPADKHGEYDCGYIDVQRGDDGGFYLRVSLDCESNSSTFNLIGDADSADRYDSYIDAVNAGIDAFVDWAREQGGPVDGAELDNQIDAIREAASLDATLI